MGINPGIRRPCVDVDVSFLSTFFIEVFRLVFCLFFNGIFQPAAPMGLGHIRIKLLLFRCHRWLRLYPWSGRLSGQSSCISVGFIDGMNLVAGPVAFRWLPGVTATSAFVGFAECATNLHGGGFRLLVIGVPSCCVVFFSGAMVPAAAFQTEVAQRRSPDR
jgi:hypothetical protein